METDKYSSILIEPGVYLITDYNFDSMYLIVGTQKAILLDTGMGTGDLKGFVSELTDKPIEVVISHAHPDHILQANQFDKVYMSDKEKEIVKILNINVDVSGFIDIKEGDRFDLGGRIIEVIELPGHTPGSIVLLDRENRLLFTGDAIGSGHVWMQVPGCMSVEVYLQSIKRLESMSDLFDKIYTGHLSQVGNNPLHISYITDMRIITEKVLNGEVQGEPYPYGPFGGLSATYGMATLVYNPENLR